MSKRKDRGSSGSENIEVSNPSKRGYINNSMMADNDSPGEMTNELLSGMSGSNINEKTLMIVSNIQDKLDSFFKKLDHVSNEVDSIKNDIKKRNGIEERLELVCIEATDQGKEIDELRRENKKLTGEVELMKSYIIRLEQRVNSNTVDITNQAARGMRNNLIFTGVKETDGENLFEKVNEIIVKELKLDPVKFDRIHRIGPKTNKSYPRSIVGKCFDYAQRENVLRHAKHLKNGIKIHPQFPESNRENRKRAFDLHKKYEEENVETKVVGEKLVFKQSGNQYREKISLPKANTVLTSKTETNYKVYHSDLITDGENKFQAHAIEISSIKEAREASLQVLKEPEIARANHNVLACVYLNRNGELKDSMDDDMEFGAARKILNLMYDKEIANCMIIVSRWNPHGQKLGPKRFDHFKSCSLNVMKKVFVV